MLTICASDAMGAGLSSVWYTTDGSDPWTSTSRVTYTAPFALYTDAVVRVVAADNAGNEARAYQAVYTIVPEGTGIAAVVVVLAQVRRRPWRGPRPVAVSVGATSTSRSVAMNVEAASVPRSVA
jgi:hypothetical protein